MTTAVANWVGLDLAVGRVRRVLLLLVGIACLSCADLAVTLTHLRTIGMAEANPIAAFVIEWGGSWLWLAVYKAGTVGLAVGVLYRLRRTVQGEIGCWLGLAILVGMSLQWHAYTGMLDSAGVSASDELGLRTGRWLTLAN